MIRYARNAFATAMSKPSRYISIDRNINVNITRGPECKAAPFAPYFVHGFELVPAIGNILQHFTNIREERMVPHRWHRLLRLHRPYKSYI